MSRNDKAAVDSDRIYNRAERAKNDKLQFALTDYAEVNLDARRAD